MSGGRLELHRDDAAFAFGTHGGASAADDLYVKNADFLSCGVQVGVLIKNTTKDIEGIIISVTETVIVSSIDILTDTEGNYLTDVDGNYLYDSSLTWDYGDEYEIYLTATEDSVISSIWTDKRYGRKSEKSKLSRGLRPEDVDVDEYESHVFGPGHPELPRV